MAQENEIYEYTGLLGYPQGLYELRKIDEDEKRVRMKRFRDGDGNKVSSEIHTVSLDDFEEEFEKESKRT